MNREIKSRLALILLIFCLAQSIYATNSNVYQNECKIDQDCAPPYYLCSDTLKCKHKSIFWPQLKEIAGVILLGIFLMLATAGGIGGGSISVPMLILLMEFTTKQAVAIGSGIVFLNAITIYIMSLFKKHPTIVGKTLIDYNLSLAMLAPIMIGSLFGSIIAVVVPSIFQLLLLIVIIIVSIAKTFMNTIRIWKEESHHNASKKQQVKDKDPSHQETPPEYKIGEFSDCRIGPVAPIQSEKVAREAAYLVKCEIELAPDSPQKGSLLISKEIKRLKRIDGQNFNLLKSSIIFLIFILSIAVVLVRGGKSMKSLLGITKCSGFDWATVIGYTILTILLYACSVQVIYREQTEKIAAKWVKQRGEVELSPNMIVKISLLSIFAGFVGSMTGISGSFIFSPILLTLGYGPQVVASTGMFIVFLNKTVSVLVYSFSGLVPWDYLSFIGFISVILVIIGIWRLNIIIKKSGRQSIISIIFMGIVTLALGLTIYAATDTILSASSNLLVFKSLCD